MAAAPRNSATTTRGRPFAPGNPGRPKGTRHKATLAVEAMLDGEAAKLTRKAIDLAEAGDTTALRLCLERIAAPRKERTIQFDMPPVTGPQDHPAALAALLAAVAAGHLAPAEAQAIANLIGEHRKAIELADVDARLTALEQRITR